MEHEVGVDSSADQFYWKGQKLMQRGRAERESRLIERERHATASQEEQEAARGIDLLEGKLKREELKKALL
jgi:hypothetical protein